MKLKVKLISSIISCCLVIGMVVTGIWAASTGTVSLGGTVSFVARDIIARVTGSVSGTQETITLPELNYTAGSTPEQSTLDKWTNLVLTFASKQPVEIDIIVENLSSQRCLYANMQDNLQLSTNSNMTKTLTNDDNPYSGSVVAVEALKTTTFTITLAVANPAISALDFEFGYTLYLNNDNPNNDNPDIITSSDESLGRVSYSVDGNKLSYEVQKEENVQFVGLKNVSTGEFEFLNIPTIAQTAALQTIGDYTFADAYAGQFVNSDVIYNVDAYYQGISSIPRDYIISMNSSYPGLLEEYDRFITKKEMYEIDYQMGTIYKTVFTSGGTLATENGYTYYAYQDAGISIIKSYAHPTDASGDIAIPETLGGLPVKGIFLTAENSDMGFEAVFTGEITSVTMPDILNIPEGAFMNVSTLESIIVADTVTHLGSAAFMYCTNLESAEIGNSVTSIGASTFSHCSLSSITIPDSVTSIGAGAFNSSLLSTITIPDSVTSIGAGAFAGCTSLSNIEIPDGVTSIGDSTFSHCSSLVSITIPDSVTSIGDYAFNGCTSLTSITIPNGVTSINLDAFKGCTNLSNIEIPNSVTCIGDGAFWGCTSLLNIEIPDSVKEIDDSAFAGCTGLSNIEIPDGVTRIGNGTFDGCTNLVSITIPNSVTSIGTSAFYGCDALTDIYYQGTEEEWSAITISDGNTSLTNATIHYKQEV